VKSKFLLLSVVFITVVAAACARQGTTGGTSASNPSRTNTSQRKADPHGHDTSASRVPAFQRDDASLNKLSPTLAPEQFFGKTREAYKAVREIPQTIAQLPCYCFCDEGHGHKSLHSCFEDDHASHCAVCVDEALLAYRLEKEQKMAAPRIRELIVAKYSSQQ
jgi:hypothetical protein